ncbi:MAG TPA: helix-turn-helix transcriptional regulator [Pyrinomonadaceae bacterium]
MDGEGLQPARLPEKLRQIRKALGLTPAQMLKRLGVEGLIERETIADYEWGRSDLPLKVLLQYARVARVFVEDLIDDELDLPEKLPGTAKHEGIKHQS